MTKFTPGPWYKNFTGDAKWEINADGYPVSDVYGWTQEIDEANARLIVAAPDMFEALKNLLGACDRADFDGDLSPYVDGELLDNARTAIKLATGGSDE